MDENTTQQIKEIFKTLPQEVQSFILSPNYEETLTKVGQQYSLSADQLGLLKIETTLAMLGLTAPEDLGAELTNQLNIDSTKSSNIYKEVDNKIFSSVKRILESLNAQPGEDKEVLNTDAEEELDNRFTTLPPEVQGAIRKINYHGTLANIAEEQKIALPQMVILETITTNVMLGIIKGNEFEKSIKESLKLSDEKTKEVADVVTKRILNEIRGEMKETYKTPVSMKKTEPENDVQLFSEHGIEIISDTTEAPLPKQVQLEKTELPIASPSISAQKLFTPVVMPAIKTDHSLPNLSSPASPAKVEEVKTPISYPKNADPYRLSPEE